MFEWITSYQAITLIFIKMKPVATTLILNRFLTFLEATHSA